MLLSVVILSIAQGLSEFLPISSSAHLLLIPWFFNLPNPGLSFDAAIHLGTAIALLLFFYRDWIKLFKSRSPLIKYILIASIPGALVGFFGDKWIEEHLHVSSYAPLIVGIGMVLFSLIMYYVDQHATLKRDEKSLNLKDSILIGLAQVLALVPGTSRSGVTITAGLLLDLDRESAARFSFLLATPITVGAGLYKTLQLVSGKAGAVSPIETIIGVVISAVVGFIVIKWLLNYLAKHDLKLFVWYRIAIAIVVIITWYLRK